MILGIGLTWPSIMFGGFVTFFLLGFQVLVGARVIKFKGRTHMKVHKWGGYVLLAVAAVHGFLAATLYSGWTILS